MNRTSNCLCPALLASAFALLASNVPGQTMTANTKNSGDIVGWIDAGADEVCGLASPIPQLLFSLPPTEFKTDTFHFLWLAGAELAPFQERLNPDARLIDLTNQMMVRDPVFWELVTTDGLIINFTARPKDPIPACHHIRSIRLSGEPPWENFWQKSLPVPSAIRSKSFTRELMREEDKLSRNAARRFCSSCWPSVSIIHENTF